MAVVYLGLGSNLGEREKNILSALKKLGDSGVTLREISTLIQTAPVSVPADSTFQSLYLNAVARFETQLSPQELLIVCLEIESELGRVRSYRNAPRTIDIDILLYDDLKINTPELTLPHPRMRERDFVMKPLEEIAPELVAAWRD